jgi:hypothetical protein
MNIFGKYGGLTLIRRSGETIVMRWPGRDIVLETKNISETTAVLVVAGDEFKLSVGESIEVPGPTDDRPANCLITLDDIAAERAAIRIVAPRRVAIVRGERMF